MTRKLSQLEGDEKKCVEALLADEIYDSGWRLMRWIDLSEPLKNFYSHRQQELRQARGKQRALDPAASQAPGDIVFEKILRRYGAEEDVRLATPSDDALMAYRPGLDSLATIVLASEAPCKLSAKFLCDLAVGKVVDESGAVVRPLRGVRLSGVVVEGALDFELMRDVASLDLWQCWLQGGLNFTSSEVSHIRLMQCWTPRIRGDQAQVKGSIFLFRVQVGEEISLASAKIASDVDLVGVHTRGDLVCAGVVIDGRLNIRCDEPDAGEGVRRASVIGGTIHLNGATIFGPLEFGNVEVRGGPVAINAYGAHFKGGVAARGQVEKRDRMRERSTIAAKVGEFADKWTPDLTTTGGAISFIQARIEGGCRLGGAQFKPYLDDSIDLTNSVWSGIAFWMVDCQVNGPLRLSATNEKTPKGQTAEIRGLVGIRNTTIEGDLELWGARFDAVPCKASVTEYTDCEIAIELVGVHVKHDLTFDDPNYPFDGEGETASHIEGAAIVSGCHIGGDLRLGRANWQPKCRKADEPDESEDLKRRKTKPAPPLINNPVTLAVVSSEVGGDVRIARRGAKRMFNAGPKFRDGIVDFSGTTLRAFNDGEDGSAWDDARLVLDGCTYQRFAESGSRLKWLKRQARPTTEPYHFAAKTLLSAGHYVHAHSAISAIPATGGLGSRVSHFFKFLFFGLPFKHGYGAIRSTVGLALWLVLGAYFADQAINTGLLVQRDELADLVREAPGLVSNQRCNSLPFAYALDAMLIGIDLGPERRCVLEVGGWNELWKILYGVASTLWLVMTALIYTRVLRRDL